MNLFSKLQDREAQGKPLRVGLIGAGKFAAMYLAQVPRTPGVRLVAIADLAPANARTNLERIGWSPAVISATSISDDWQKLVSNPEIDIVIEATGNPVAAVEHILAALKHGKHVVNVTVEADAFCGPMLAQKAKEAGVVYSLAYGDQPAIICDLVDWARAAGFPVVAAGRGHKWLPHYAQSTPETGRGYYGLTPEQAKRDGTAIPYDIRFGVWVVFEGESEYIRRCFSEYGVKTDPSGRYACMYKRWHLIGLEVGISVASVGLRGEPTGCATGWRADAIAVAKKDLRESEILDGEGGYTVVGRLMPAADSLAQGCLPLGLAHGWKLLRPVAAGEALKWSDVAFEANLPAVKLRREMEISFAPSLQDAA